MLVLNEVINKYPKTRYNAALTGDIPIEDFNELEPFIRPEMRQKGLRVIYRGPRKSNSVNQPSMTRRCDATHALLYYK